LARTPHFSLPFRLSGTSFAVSEQDSAEEIADCVEAILRTPEGSRIDVPGFGRPDGTFAQLGATAPSSEPYLAAVEEWEPRAVVSGTAEVEDAIERIVVKESA
jgi:phage baseplate assembly protein W